MTAYDVEYIEIYASDRKCTIDYFVSSFGFTEVARSRTAGRDSALLRQGGVQLVVTSGPDTDDFLTLHGDGVADIAFACEDAIGARDSALAAGATLLSQSTTGAPVVSGFGVVRHTLVQRPAGGAPAFPADREWTVPAPPAVADPSTPVLRKLDHVAVCLDAGTLHDVVRFYIEGFGFTQFYSEYVTVGEQAMDSIVVRSPSDDITFTIIEPDTTKKSGQIDEFLNRNGGGGVQHLAFLVDEIIPSVLEFQHRGIEFLQTPGTYYDALAERIPSLEAEIAGLRKANVLADLDEWGHLLQLFSRSPFERRTLFFELIQRQGAQGFGSANIRALYEAVERARELAS
ncbi:4-hydroxyphenylpyruvate dioxygenase [Streptomyces sp. SID14515]|uniref:4-hydroxyphenylpyruvate dioxygenase n=1 Tax=Streptomyces sp. SID14515 TaxID=2706074 RepID=UPI0013CD68CD|nr:4-hydroxyphenylpyruvate dioxygenase [Streptomyces sp. SID14515]NEB42184.1 4-hydroxyphenylpyruvate dioxygenase [Streptomyces sp. SID14515]